MPWAISGLQLGTEMYKKSCPGLPNPKDLLDSFGKVFVGLALYCQGRNHSSCPLDIRHIVTVVHGVQRALILGNSQFPSE
jgi:hypothetical protein